MMLRVEHLSHAYGTTSVLSDVCFNVAAGSIVGLIGPNGGGKSTILNIISGALRPAAGGVWLGDIDLLRLSPHDVSRQGIIRLPQRPVLSKDLNSYNNISLGIYHSNSHLGLRWSETTPELIQRAAARCSLSSKQLRAFPRDLSFFEQRMVELARCIVARPNLLLLDETTSGFTEDERLRTSEILQSFKPDTTTILVEHDVDLVRRLSDHVIALAHGKVLAGGMPEEVLNHPAVAEAYLGKAHAAN